MTIVIQISSYLFVIVTNLDVWCHAFMTSTWQSFSHLNRLQQFLRHIEYDLMTIVIRICNFHLVTALSFWLSCSNFFCRLDKLKTINEPFRQIEDDLMTIVIQISSHLFVIVTNLDVWCDECVTFTWQRCSQFD